MVTNGGVKASRLIGIPLRAYSNVAVKTITSCDSPAFARKSASRLWLHSKAAVPSVVLGQMMDKSVSGPEP